jgi:hypothetical protein
MTEPTAGEVLGPFVRRFGRGVTEASPGSCRSPGD